MKTFLIIGITLVAGLFIAGAFAVSTAGSTTPPSAAVLIEKTITANGIYDASDDGADGFSQVTVNVPATGLPVKPSIIVDCGGVDTNVVILNRFYADHFGDGDAEGVLILNVCGVYWDVRENLISLDNGATWLNKGIVISQSGQMWQCCLINLPNPSLGVTQVTNTLNYVKLKEFVFGSGVNEFYNDGNFHPLTPQLYNWNLLNSLENQITTVGITVDEEIYD